MSILVVCNIGASDLLENDVPLRPSRPEGERVWQALQANPGVESSLSLPILQPTLEYLLRRHPQGLDRMVMFATNQPAPGSPGEADMRPTDTLFIGFAAKCVIENRFAGKIGIVEVQLVEGINPSLVDEAYSLYGRLVGALVKNDRYDTCYAELSGGSPACNTALLLQGVRYFGNAWQVIYVPRSGEPQPLRIGREVMQSRREEAVLDLLQRKDFANALPLLAELEVSAGLYELVRYAARRLDFDFRAAQAALDRAVCDGSRIERRFIARSLRHSLDGLLGNPQLEALLWELYWNACITWQHHRYADFLGRVYRIQEALLRLMVERMAGLKTDLAPDVRTENQRAWESAILADPPLLDYLKTVKINGHPLDWRNIARPAYKALLGFKLDQAGANASGSLQRWQELFKRTNQLDELVERRHRTIIGHGFEGVSEETLRAAYRGGKTSPPEGLAEIMRLACGTHPDDPYTLVADFVSRQLVEGDR